MFYQKGQRVWHTKHPKLGWAQGVVLEGSNLVTITCEDMAQYSVPNADLLPLSEESLADYTDMVQIDDLNEGVMLNNLKKRFNKDNIYTSIGEVLVAVNPWKFIPRLYDEETMKGMVSHPAAQSVPHVYAMAERSYRHMIRTGENQSILVSGESGSGKTETCKHLIQYLSFVSARAGGGGDSIERKLVEAGPILEAFGNAQTARNNNSSRFGKFIKVRFNSAGHMLGATITHYLLEKSRIVKQGPGERNFAVFHQLVEGCADDERRTWGLMGAFSYLGPGASPAQKAVDAKMFAILKRQMKVLEIPDAEQTFLFGTLAAVLHIGNITFTESAEGVARITERRPLEFAAMLLGLFPGDLEMAMTSRKFISPKRGSIVARKLTREQAFSSRDALAKTIYSKVFAWLLATINTRLNGVVGGKPSTSGRADGGAGASSSGGSGKEDPDVRLIGILDIFGFEIFDQNSLEQFLINYANESLQNLFNRQLFLAEQQEYVREKLPWTQVKYVGNEDIVATIEQKPTGILPMLDEECMLPQGSDTRLLGKMNTTHAASRVFLKSRTAGDTFQIKHFAGDVSYSIHGFLEKNKDLLYPDLEEMMLMCSNPFVNALFKKTMAPTGTLSRYTPTVGGQFRIGLNTLITELSETNTHFIRCVKPNPAKEVSEFDSKYVLEQMRCVGMLETVKVRKMGYSTRVTFPQFIERYKLVVAPLLTPAYEAKRVIEKLLTHISPAMSGLPGGGKSNDSIPAWQLGVSKVFLRDKPILLLEELRRRKVEEERKRREEEERKRREEEERKRREEEERKRREAEERRRKEEEERKRKEEEERRRREAEERKRKEEEEERLRVEAARRKDEEEKIKLEAARRKEEERKIKEDAERKEKDRLRKIDEDRKRGEIEDAARREDERKRVDMEQAAKRQEDDRRKKELEERKKYLEDERRRLEEDNLLRKKKPFVDQQQQSPMALETRAEEEDRWLREEAERRQKEKRLPQAPALQQVVSPPSSQPSTPSSAAAAGKSPLSLSVDGQNGPKSSMPSASETLGGVSLEEALSNMDVFMEFAEFLTESNGGAQNLEFWTEIQTYKKLPNSALRSNATQIFNKYFSEGSDHKLELGPAIISTIRSRMMTPSNSTFRDVENWVVAELEQKYFPKFLGLNPKAVAKIKAKAATKGSMKSSLHVGAGAGGPGGAGAGGGGGGAARPPIPGQFMYRRSKSFGSLADLNAQHGIGPGSRPGGGAGPGSPAMDLMSRPSPAGAQGSWSRAGPGAGRPALGHNPSSSTLLINPSKNNPAVSTKLPSISSSSSRAPTRTVVPNTTPMPRSAPASPSPSYSSPAYASSSSSSSSSDYSSPYRQPQQQSHYQHDYSSPSSGTSTSMPLTASHSSPSLYMGSGGGGGSSPYSSPSSYSSSSMRQPAKVSSHSHFNTTPAKPSIGLAALGGATRLISLFKRTPSKSEFQSSGSGYSGSG